jgi:hypothetical protein
MNSVTTLMPSHNTEGIPPTGTMLTMNSVTTLMTSHNTEGMLPTGMSAALDALIQSSRDGTGSSGTDAVQWGMDGEMLHSLIRATTLQEPGSRPTAAAVATALEAGNSTPAPAPTTGALEKEGVRTSNTRTNTATHAAAVTTNPELAELAAFAEELADKSEPIILKHFRRVCQLSLW